MNRCEDIDKPYIYEEEIVDKIRDFYSQTYKEGYEDGKYWGRREMWECARKIVGMWADIEDKELKDIFGFDDIVDIFKNLSFSKAMEKIEDFLR